MSKSNKKEKKVIFPGPLACQETFIQLDIFLAPINYTLIAQSANKIIHVTDMERLSTSDILLF